MSIVSIIDAAMSFQCLVVNPLGNPYDTNELQSRSTPDTTNYTFGIENVSIGIKATNIVLYLTVIPPSGASGSLNMTIAGQDVAAGSVITYAVMDPDDPSTPLELGYGGVQSITVPIVVNRNSTSSAPLPTPEGDYRLLVGATFDPEPLVDALPEGTVPSLGGGFLFVEVQAD